MKQTSHLPGISGCVKGFCPGKLFNLDGDAIVDLDTGLQSM